LRLAIRWAVYLEVNKGKSDSYNCVYCESKGLQKQRNCDGDLTGYCKRGGHGYFEFEDLIINDKGQAVCPACEKPVEMPFKLQLGKTFWIWRCPVLEIDHSAIHLIQMVNWSEAMHQTPSGLPLYDESNLFFEIRNFVLNEQRTAREEMEKKQPSDARKSKQGSRPRKRR